MGAATTGSGGGADAGVGTGGGGTGGGAAAASRRTQNTAEQTEHLARTPAAGTLSGSTRKTV
ncbi:MAG TPA: hypothetical protein VGQ69_02645 [Gemmatimonadales bacterium]|nr:hypothetical protein [Gemmatimonadales bacterium]